MKMKRILLFCGIIVLLESCNPEPLTYVSYHSNGANFYIVNTATNDTVHNEGVVIYTGDSVYSAPNNINACYGNVLKLIYQPPQKYMQSPFEVLIKAFGKDYLLTTKPYVKEITINPDFALGVYPINCDAKADEWLEGSSDKGILQVTILDSK